MGKLSTFLHPVDPLTRKYDPVMKKAAKAADNSGLDPTFHKTWYGDDQEDGDQTAATKRVSQASSSEGQPLLGSDETLTKRRSYY